MDQGLFARNPVYRIFVGNMGSQITEDELRVIVERFGNVKNVYLVKVEATGQTRGFAFVEMTDKEAADRAIAALNGAEINGRCLKVRLGF